LVRFPPHHLHPDPALQEKRQLLRRTEKLQTRPGLCGVPPVRYPRRTPCPRVGLPLPAPPFELFPARRKTR
jgi:hypothetical protein